MSKIFEKVTGSLLCMYYQQQDTRKWITLLDVLFTPAESEAYEYLTHQGYPYDQSHNEERIEKLSSLFITIRRKNTIADVASIANIAEASFCCYFRSKALTTFTCFLNEV